MRVSVEMNLTGKALHRVGVAAVIAVLVLLGLGPDTVRAQAVPDVIPQQGRLLNGSGVPITTTVSVEFAIYGAPSGGSPVWSETKPITPDNIGFYETMLGDTTPLPSALPNPSYLQLTVAGETLSPRLQVGSVPFALRSGDGVPAGYSILGDTPMAPPGYTPAGAFRAGEYWAAKAMMPTARYALGAAAVNGKIYAIGGRDGAGTDLMTVEEYDPAMNAWTTKAAMPTARSYLGVAAVNDRIYAIGGLSGSTHLATVEEYDPATDTWTAKAAMPTARGNLGVAAANGRIYAIGGGTAGTVVEEYDPATDTWMTMTPMPTMRIYLGVAAVNGKIYAIGGYGIAPAVKATVEEYDPATDTWAARTPMPTARLMLSAVAAGNRVYAIGGFNPPTVLATVEEYDPATDTWETRAAMPTARRNFGAAALGNNIYAIGGQDAGGAATAAVEAYGAPVLLYMFTKD